MKLPLIYTVFALFSVSVFAADTPSAPSSPVPPVNNGNLVPNSSFEGPALAPWFSNNYPHNEVDLALDKENPHSGAQCLRIGIKKVVGRGVFPVYSGPVKVAASDNLQLRCWLRGTANTRPVTIQICKYTPPQSVYFNAVAQLTDKWTESVFNIKLPKDIDPQDMHLQFSPVDANTFWLDDVSLSKLPDIDSAPPLVGNQIKNGSFEVGRDCWYAQFTNNGRMETQNQANEDNMTGGLETRTVADAPHGKNVLAFQVHEGCRAKLNSAYIPLRYGHPVTVRFWMKTNAPVGSGVQVNLGRGKNVSNCVSQEHGVGVTSNEWNAYEFEVTPLASPSGTYYLELVMERPGEYQVDAFSITEGVSKGSAFIQDKTELGWSPMGKVPSGNLFHPGEKAVFALNAIGACVNAKLPVDLTIVDFQEKLLKHVNLEIPVDAKGVGTIKMVLPCKRYGGFKVEARLSKDGAPAAELLYSVLPKLPPLKKTARQSFFGGHFNYSPYNLDIAEQVGFRWLRLPPTPLYTKWLSVEPKKGEWNFDTRGVIRATDRGFQLLGMFESTPEFYATGKSGSIWNSFVPADWEAWRRYVQKTAEVFSPYISYWEVWNEPDISLCVPAGMDKAQAYVDIATHTREALESVGRGEFLIGNVTAGIETPFTDKQLALGGGSQVDAISFHFYNETMSPEERKPDLAERLAKWRSFPNRSGATPELWHTEGGMWLHTARSWMQTAAIPILVTTNIEDATNSLVRTVVGLKALGVKHHFQYVAIATPSGRLVYRDECASMIDVNGIPNPAGAAHAAMVLMLDDAQPEANALQKGNDVTVARFKKASGNPIAVVWTRKPNLTLADVPALDFKGAKGYDIMGNKIAISAQTPISINPIYILNDK